MLKIKRSYSRALHLATEVHVPGLRVKHKQ